MSFKVSLHVKENSLLYHKTSAIRTGFAFLSTKTQRRWKNESGVCFGRAHVCLGRKTQPSSTCWSDDFCHSDVTHCNCSSQLHSAIVINNVKRKMFGSVSLLAVCCSRCPALCTCTQRDSFWKCFIEDFSFIQTGNKSRNDMKGMFSHTASCVCWCRPRKTAISTFMDSNVWWMCVVSCSWMTSILSCCSHWKHDYNHSRWAITHIWVSGHVSSLKQGLNTGMTFLKVIQWLTLVPWFGPELVANETWTVAWSPQLLFWPWQPRAFYSRLTHSFQLLA